MAEKKSITERRKALGWDRQQLAERAGIDRFVVQLIERGEWEEGEARMRVDIVLERAEAGEADVRLERIQIPPDAPTPGSEQP